MNHQSHRQLITFGCCHHIKCWCDERLPNYCPECGHSLEPTRHTARLVELINLPRHDFSQEYNDDNN